MKKIISAAVVAFIGMSVFAYDVTANTQLKGSVKSVTKINYTIASKFGDYFRTPNSKFIYKYDGSGKLVESTEFTPRDVVVNTLKNAYDVAGTLTEQVVTDAENIQIVKNVITYKDGKKSEISEYAKDGSLKSKTIYTYEGTKLVDETYYNAEGAIVWKIVYTYNAKNQLEKESEYYSDGSLSEERVYEYADNGKIDNISYSTIDSLKEKEVFRYDASGNLGEITTYGADNKTTKRLLIKYDSVGNVIKLTTYNVSKKFGTTANEMTDMVDFAYQY